MPSTNPQDDFQATRQQYLDYLIYEYAQHTLRGFAPQVGNRVISLPLAKVFLPLKAIENAALFGEHEKCLPDDQHGASEKAQKSTPVNDIEPAQKTSLSLSDLLASPRAVLLGDPGSGKTTMARYITYALAAQDYTQIGNEVTGLIPILVRVANYARAVENDGSLPLIDYIEKELNPRSEYGRYLRHAIENNQCLIILDGLDEVLQLPLRMRVTENIRYTVDAYINNRFLITSRVIGYHSSPLTHGFKHAVLSDLEVEDQERFVRLWFEAIGAEFGKENIILAGEDLIQALHNRPQIGRLAASPLLLTIIILMYWRGVKLPSRRIQIYQNATDTLIEYWTTQRGFFDMDAEEIKSILAPIAHHILSSNVSGSITQHELLPRLYEGIRQQRGCTIDEARQVGNALLKALGEQSGIFLERGLDTNGNPVYGFLHWTFGEYLAALHLTQEVLNGSFEIQKYVYWTIWYEPILLAASHLSIISPRHLNNFLHAILDAEPPLGKDSPPEALHRNIFLAIDCMADDVQLGIQLRNEILDKLIELLFDEAEQLRETAISRMSELSATRHKEATIEALKKQLSTFDTIDAISAKGRFSIAQALIYLGEAELAKPYLFPLEHESHAQDISLNKIQYLRLAGWPDQADSYLYELYVNQERAFHLNAAPDLSHFIFGVTDARRVRSILGQSRMLALVNRLLNDAYDHEDKATFQLLAAIVPDPVDIVTLYLLIKQGVPTQARCLAAICLLDTQYRNEAIDVLQEISITEPEQAVQATTALVRVKQQLFSPYRKAHYYLTKAGFEVTYSASSTFFICKPQHQIWRQHVRKAVPVKVLSGVVLDMNMVLSLVEESTQLLGETPYCIFVLCDNIPSDGAWLQIAAQRDNGVNVMPIDDSVLNTGIQQNRHLAVLLDHLEERYLSPQRDLYDRQNPISDRLNFYGRERLSEQLINDLDRGHAVALFGLRKMGKSSLLNHIRDRLPYPAAVIDLEAGTDLWEVYNRIIAAWTNRLQALHPMMNWQLPERNTGETPSVWFERASRRLLKTLTEADTIAKLTVFIDEIELIYPHTTTELGKYLDFARTLRGLAQEHIGQFGFMVVGVDPNIVRTNRLFGRQNPFYNFLRIQYLPPLSMTDCQQMIRNIGVQMGLIYEDDAVDFVATVTGGHPYWARKLCSLAFQTWKEKVRDGAITHQQLVATARRFIQHPDTAQLLDQRGLWGEVTDSYLWADEDAAANEAILLTLSENEQRTRPDLLAQTAKPATHNRSLIELGERTIINEVKNDTFSIHLQLFRNWIRTDKLGKE